MSNWKGTTVPNSGVVEKVYFNTNLSVEEVVNILSGLEYMDTADDPIKMYPIFVNSDFSKTLIVYKFIVSATEFEYAICDLNFTTYYFGSKENIAEDILSPLGWNNEIVNPLIINENNVMEEQGLVIDTEIVSSLFSITPFTQSEDKNILMHPYNEDGTANKDVNLYPRTKVGNLLANNGSKFTMPNVAYKQGGWQGEVVPNSGTVEKVYFNTNLSVEEVVSILESITEWETDSEGASAYFVFRSENEDYIGVSSMNGQYVISSMINGSDHFDFIYPEVEGLGVGWIDGVRNPLDINIQAISSYGTENNKLASLFSITPFEESSGGLFETNEDGTPNTDKPIQTGISEEQVNTLIDNKITGWLGGES